MPRSASKFSAWLLPLLGVLALGLAGCSQNERFSYAAEADEPNYREGMALLKTGRRQEALTSFLKVIDKRGEDSAESHLEVGLLYLEHINDPLSAIYHFKKFLSLRPNSPQAPLVKQRIDAATRDFARTLPAQPLESQLQRVDLVATMNRLKLENESLKQELATARAGRGLSVETPVAGVVETVNPAQPEPVDTVSPTPVATDAAGGDYSFSLDTLPTVRTRRPPQNIAPAQTVTVPTRPNNQPQPKQAQVQTPPPQPKAATPTPAPASPAGGRRHIVRPGETLSQIAFTYYKNRAKWRDIYAANRNVMRSETDLKVGMQIRIP